VESNTKNKQTTTLLSVSTAGVAQHSSPLPCIFQQTQDEFQLKSFPKRNGTLPFVTPEFNEQEMDNNKHYFSRQLLPKTGYNTELHFIR
jgi:hypothetical protein